MALIGMCFFLGWTFASFFIPRLADIYGRKLGVVISLVLQLASMIVINFAGSVELLIAMNFTFGMACVGSRSISFLYLMELLPKKSQVTVGTALNISDAVIPVLGCLYFWKISNNWLWFMIIFAEAFTVIGLIGILLLPESPKFLITMKRYDEARAGINYFLKNTQHSRFNAKFDREVIDEKKQAKQNQIEH